jgi:hypothetical protein
MTWLASVDLALIRGGRCFAALSMTALVIWDITASRRRRLLGMLFAAFSLTEH